MGLDLICFSKGKQSIPIGKPDFIKSQRPAGWDVIKSAEARFNQVPEARREGLDRICFSKRKRSIPIEKPDFIQTVSCAPSPCAPRGDQISAKRLLCPCPLCPARGPNFSKTFLPYAPRGGQISPKRFMCPCPMCPARGPNFPKMLAFADLI